MTDDKKKPEDETPKVQAEDAKPSENLSDEELGKAAGGRGIQVDYENTENSQTAQPTYVDVTNIANLEIPDDD